MAQYPYGNWIAEGLTRFGVDTILYSPFAFVPATTPFFILHAAEQPLAGYLSYCHTQLDYWSSQGPGLLQNVMMNKWQWELFRTSLCNDFCAAVNTVTNPVFNAIELVSDAVVDSLLTGYKDVDQHINNLRATLAPDDDRHEFLDDLQIAYAPYKFIYDWFTSGSYKKMAVNAAKVGLGPENVGILANPSPALADNSGANASRAGASMIAPRLQPQTFTAKSAGFASSVAEAAPGIHGNASGKSLPSATAKLLRPEILRFGYPSSHSSQKPRMNRHRDWRVFNCLNQRLPL